MNRLTSLVESPRFQLAVIGLIVVNAVLIGVETSDALMQAYGPILLGASYTIQGLFLLEIALRLAAHWPRPGRFFREGWNVFDFTIVAVSLLPATGPFATVGRLARLLRVVRLISVAPDLRLIVTTMLRSIPSMLHVVMLMGLLIYVYAVAGFHLFRHIDPAHWGTLGRALLTTFQMLTLEGWVEMQAAVLPTLPWAWLFFGSYVVVNVFVVVNLFVAVVLNNLESVKHDEELAKAAKLPAAELLAQVQQMRLTLDALEARLRADR